MWNERSASDYLALVDELSEQLEVHGAEAVVEGERHALLRDENAQRHGKAFVHQRRAQPVRRAAHILRLTVNSFDVGTVDELLNDYLKFIILKQFCLVQNTRRTLDRL